MLKVLSVFLFGSFDSNENGFKDLSRSIVENFHGKRVNCCPKCLQDHLITDVVVAHATLEALTEAISCAAYWQRCLDDLVEKTCGLTQAQKGFI